MGANNNPASSTGALLGSELPFQTDGPIICQALFQRLSPRPPPPLVSPEPWVDPGVQLHNLAPLPGGQVLAVEYLSDEYFKLLCRPVAGNGSLAKVEYLSDEYFKLLRKPRPHPANGALGRVEYLSDEYFKLLRKR